MPRFLSIAGGVALVFGASFVGCNCSRTAEPTADPFASASALSSAAAAHPAPPPPAVRPHEGKLEKDPDSGHYIPTTPLPPVDSALLPPAPKREPDMDLDPDDPARDYVQRYVMSSNRYGDKAQCTLFGKSYAKSGERAVDVSDDPACSNGSTTLRDTFHVDIGADRLSRESSVNPAPLQLWPDGSDPGGPPKAVREINDMKAWSSSIHQLLKDLLLVAVRVQLYGRGTYPVITIAGWRPQFGRSTTTTAMDDAAKQICDATVKGPVSFFAGIDRSTTLRVRCEGGVKWRWDAF